MRRARIHRQDGWAQRCRKRRDDAINIQRIAEPPGFRQGTPHDLKRMALAAIIETGIAVEVRAATDARNGLV
jgi:hypothetical protein